MSVKIGGEDGPDPAIPLSELGCFGTIAFVILLTLAKAIGWLP